ncbi:hypothetical protein B0H11DRAFT_1643789, partial [Mycena galericulata]
PHPTSLEVKRGKHTGSPVQCRTGHACIGEYHTKFVPSKIIRMGCRCGELFQMREYILLTRHRDVRHEASNQISITDILGREKGIQVLAEFLESSGALR